MSSVIPIEQVIENTLRSCGTNQPGGDLMIESARDSHRMRLTWVQSCGINKVGSFARTKRSWVSRLTILSFVAVTLLVSSLLVTIAVQSAPLPPPVPFGQSGDWKLLFRDEFDDRSLNRSLWVTCYWWDDDGCTNLGNNELEWYRPENVFLRDGVLNLRAREQRVTDINGQEFPYTSGMISTGTDVSTDVSSARFVFQYGFAEMRAKVPSGRGLWPAFWMLPNDYTSKPEIDVLELLGHAPDTLHFSLHYSNGDDESDRSTHEWVSTDMSLGWHTYAIDWRPDLLVWYVDGVERWRYADQEYIPRVPMYLIINLAVGGDWPGAPDADTVFPSDFEVDYVRVWINGS